MNKIILKFAVVALSVLPTLPSASSQTIIISDTFTGVSEAIQSHTPDINLPGGLYGQLGFGNTSVQNNVAQINNGGGGAAISLASNGGYTKPVVLTLSGNLDIGNISGAGFAGDRRGLGFGFVSSVSGGDLRFSPLFTGFYLSPDNFLNFVANDVVTQLAVTLLPGLGNSLSFTADTSTNSLSNVTFNGVDVTSSFSAAATNFTDASTAFAALRSSSSTGGETNLGNIDNFQASTVPEPSTYALCGLGGLALFFLRRKSRLAGV